MDTLAPTAPTIKEEPQQEEPKAEMLSLPTSTPQETTSICVGEIKEYIVRKGDCLWGISKKAEIHGNPSMWRKIYEANKNIIKDPNLIYPGQRLVIPAD